MIPIISGLLGLASNVVEGYVETKKAKAKQKLVKIEAETSLIEKKIAGEIEFRGLMERRVFNNFV
jgi:hypothetical protein